MRNNDFKDDVWCGIQKPRQEKIKKVKIKKIIIIL